jgi:large subunit ribosomal protein L25
MSKHIATVVTRDLDKKLSDIRKVSVPGNIFQKNTDSTPVELSKKEFIRLYGEVGESGVAYLKLEKKEIPVMIEEVQWHPVIDEPIHASFRAIDLTEKTEASIPVELVGEFDLPEAVLVTVRDEIEVEALPTDLPEKFEINVEQLTEIGQSVTLADLEYDREKVSLILGEEGEEAPVILVQEVEEEPEEPEEIETEIIGEEDDGETESEEEGDEKEEAPQSDEKEE